MESTTNATNGESNGADSSNVPDGLRALGLVSIGDVKTFKDVFNDYYVAVAELETARTGLEADEQVAFRALMEQEKAAEKALFAVIDAHTMRCIAISHTPDIPR